jgi:hypothetical protein
MVAGDSSGSTCANSSSLDTAKDSFDGGTKKKNPCGADAGMPKLPPPPTEAGAPPEATGAVQSGRAGRVCELGGALLFVS